MSRLILLEISSPGSLGITSQFTCIKLERRWTQTCKILKEAHSLLMLDEKYDEVNDGSLLQPAVQIRRKKV